MLPLSVFELAINDSSPKTKIRAARRPILSRTSFVALKQMAIKDVISARFNNAQNKYSMVVYFLTGVKKHAAMLRR
jgi:hypothetical protein